MLNALLILYLFTTPVIISPGTQEVQLNLRELEFYEDTGGGLTFSDVSSEAFQSEFSRNKSYTPQDYNTSSVYWVRLNLVIPHALQRDSLIGKCGFYDALSFKIDWYLPRYLVIDQGPIPVMVENYRSGLIRDLFMSAPEIKVGLEKLGFQYEKLFHTNNTYFSLLSSLGTGSFGSI